MRDEPVPTIDLEAIREDAKAMISHQGGRREHAEVLKAILDNLTELDFNQLATVDPSKPVPLKTQIVLTVAEVIRVARDLNCDLCRNQAFVYTYNGEFWQLLNRDDLERFLGEAADRVGMYWIDARHFETKAKLAKQFLADAHLPTPQCREDVVLINVRNGTLELGGPVGFVFRNFDPSDFLTYQLPFDYDPNAVCSRWQSFLDMVLPDGDRSRQKILAEFIGYVFARILNHRTLHGRLYSRLAKSPPPPSLRQSLRPVHCIAISFDRIEQDQGMPRLQINFIRRIRGFGPRVNSPNLLKTRWETTSLPN